MHSQLFNDRIVKSLPNIKLANKRNCTHFCTKYSTNIKTMITTSISDFRKDIKRYLDNVTKNFETLIINRGKDNSVVIISLDEYNSLMETVHLLTSNGT